MDDSETELISDDSDLDLEPGELPSTKSRRFSQPARHGTAGRGRGRRPALQRSPLTQTDNDDYGSESEDYDDLDSDESID